MFFESLLCTLLSILSLWFVKETFLKSSYPPGPPIIPILGNFQVLTQLKQAKFYHVLWDQLSKTYGDIVGLKFLTKHVIIISGKKMVKKMYQTEELNGRPDGFFFRVRTFNKRLGIVFTDGLFWETQRTFSVKTLKSLGFGKSSMIEHIESESEELIKYLTKSSGECIAVQDENKNIFDISVINVMWKLMSGERFELDDKEAAKLMEHIHESFTVIDMSGGVLNLLPFVRHFFPELSGFSPLIRAMQPLWAFLKKSIDKISANFESKQRPFNFIEYYIREMSTFQSNDAGFTREQLLALCIDFFQAGSETTSNTLSFAILYMLHFPEVMKKVQDELHNVVGDRLPKLIDRQNLKYSEAVICEVQRMANVAPLGIAHRAMKSFKVGSYVIPKDSIVLFNLFSLHMDQEWGDPMQFRPERFLENGNLKFHENFVPFGLGKRRCVGENLAKSSLFLIFVSILHVFKIEAVGKLPHLKGRDGITLSPHPYYARFTRKRIFDQKYE